ncbi:hypothetical protein AVEN_147564-1 [Araneus ventricosus]|uniref:Uncharacterized protein n=1 Tax=Araneus ventricosus TaxID=182803 RepID=A0A4Y2C4M9_ARAVE|nr:hypothetical protein AVEN_147564-1 [Araneus ventricosus]
MHVTNSQTDEFADFDETWCTCSSLADLKYYMGKYALTQFFRVEGDKVSKIHVTNRATNKLDDFDETRHTCSSLADLKYCKIQRTKSTTARDSQRKCQNGYRSIEYTYLVPIKQVSCNSSKTFSVRVSKLSVPSKNSIKRYYEQLRTESLSHSFNNFV